MEKKIRSERKFVNQGYRNGRTRYVLVQTKHRRTYKQI